MPGIPDTFIDEILTRVDLVEFIGRYLQLKRAGSSHKGLCPFHGDKDPSLSISQEKGLWKCFGCGLGGNVITFVQRKENLDFPDAIRFLADLYQIPIPAVKGERPGRSRLLHDINRHAEEFYIRVLKSKYGRPYREYLKEREYDRETIESFYLGAGLSVDIWDGLTKELTLQGFAVEELLALGLTKKGYRGHYDAYRGRLIIPIRDVLSRTIGFGARLIEGEGPKYINSSDSLVFKKGDVLFGIDKAKGGIRKEGFILLVEGYTDVMRCHQHGLSNTVASMGTALTPRQVGVLKRYSDNIILCFDSDEAGQNAAERSLPILVGFEMKARLLLMPEGDDPDSVLRKKGVDEFRKLINESLHFLDFLLQRATGGEAPASVEGKVEAFRTLLPVLDAIQHQHLRDEYQEQVARFLAINPGILQDIARAARQKQETLADVENIKLNVEGESRIERDFLAGLIKYPNLISNARMEITGEDFNDRLNGEVYSIISDPSFPLESKDLSAQPQIYENRQVFSFVVDCIFSDSEREVMENSVRKLLFKMVERKLNAQNRMIESKLSSIGQNEDGEGMVDLQTRILTNRKKLEDLRKQLLG